MLSLFLLAATVPIRYDFSPTTQAVFDVEVRFEGYLPVLGGKDGKIGVDIRVAAEGQPTDPEGRPRIASEIKDFKMSMNGALMPFTAKNIADFFPRTTVSVTPLGSVLKTDAPNKKLPVRLPGLDVKRFPEITYVPIEFPEGGVEVGKAYRFRRPFGDSPMDYEVTPTKIDDDTITLIVKLSQTYVAYEDLSGNPVEQSEANVRVGTEVTGEGTATFDRKRGLVKEAKIVADALGHAVDLESKKQTDRRLKTMVRIALRP
jgi:hypothetical protein